MIFDAPFRLPRAVLRTPHCPMWRREVSAIMQRFRRAFPEIHYDIAWDVDVLNGVAWRERARQHVRLYGGLLRHRDIGPEAAALLFAHETGHHKGGPPRDKTYTWMTSERQADFWAARFGVATAWAGNEDMAKRVVSLGARQLLAFETSLVRLQGERHKNSKFVGLGEYPTPLERFQIFMSALI